MIKAILFDLDQTLIDFIKLKKNASRSAALAMVSAGLNFDKKIAGDELFKFYLEDGIEGNTAFSRFIKKHNGTVDDKMLALGLNAYLCAKKKYLKTYPGVPKVLRGINKKGIKLCVISDAPRVKVYQRLDLIGILNLFDIVVGFEDTGELKPSSLPFNKALSLLDVNPSDALMVGDCPERDILGAAKVGIKTCWARYGALDKTLDSGADFVINDIKDVLKCIED
ncbi:MAG: HAD-IA family hydrolase [DPANN group archaeon]|nr:HAD-IA family hydrolase [DPANN group archaeon]